MSLTVAEVLMGVAGASLACWLLLLLDTRRRWPAELSLHLGAAASDPRPGSTGEVVAIIPARNESSTLPRTLPRLLRQSQWLRRAILVDDRSEDHTASVARRLASGPSRDLLEVISVQDCPEGWSGKVHAMHRGMQAATGVWREERERQWILFTDADIAHPSGSIARLTTKANEDDLDLVSVMARLRMVGPWEKLLIPPFVYFFQLLYPFRRVADPGSRVAAAAGGCMLVRRRLLEELGGLESIRDAVIDDIALARRLKAAGGRCWLGLDPDMRSLRSYNSFGDVVRMVARTAFAQLGYRYWMLPVVWIGLLLLFVAPPAAAVVGAVLADPWVAGAGLAAWAIQMMTFAPVLSHHEQSPLLAPTLPVAALLYAWMTTVSAWRRLRGGEQQWREAELREVDDR